MNDRTPGHEAATPDAMLPKTSGERADLWENLQQHVEAHRPSTSNLWQDLKERMDFAKRRPRRLKAVEVVFQEGSHGEPYYVLHNPAAETYVRLDPQNYFLWERLDGEHSVQDLAVAYFANYGTFAFDRLIRLLSELKVNRLLAERATDIFGTIATRFAAKKLLSHLQRFSEGFTQKELSLKNADRFVEALYRRLGWLFFTRTAKALYVLLIGAGLAFFGSTFPTNNYSILMTAGSYGIGLVVLLGLSYVMAFVHEFGHAMACKAYGRKVPRAGALFYFGTLAWFVDTTDTWMIPKRGRIIVSLAGPFATIVLASLCAALAGLLPSSEASLVLSQTAFMGYLSSLLNMTPLLETDGYYILMDWLEIPMLRKKSFTFVRRSLLARLSKGSDSLNREEKIYTLYGLLAAVWSGFLIVFIVYFWQGQLGKMLRSIVSGRDVVSTILGGGILIIAGTPLILGLLIKGLLLVRAAVERARKLATRSARG